MKRRPVPMTITLRRKPRLVRFVNAYMHWRQLGLGRRAALAAAWRISR